MATKRQTRRSISIKGLTYQRLQVWCDANERSMSGVLEEIIHERMDQAAQPVETVLKPKPKAKTGRKSRGGSTGSGIFTF